MAIVIKPFTFVPGTVIRSSEVNLDFDVLYNLVNGNIDNANIAVGAAIALSKLQAVAPGQVLMGNGGGVITPTTLTGNITISPTGVVTVTGSGGGPPGTYNNPTFTGTTTLSGTNDFTGPLLLPTAPPLVNRSAAFVGGVLQIHDGTAARSYLRTDTWQSSSFANGGLGLGIGIVNDVGYVDVSPSVSININVTVPGQWKVEFYGSYQFAGSSSTTISSQTIFRLTDGVTNKPGVFAGMTYLAGPSGNTFIVPVCISNTFNFATPGIKNVKLQKQNIASNNTLQRFLLNIGGVVSNFEAYRIAD